MKIYETREDYFNVMQTLRGLGKGARLYESRNTMSISAGNKVITWWKPSKESKEIREQVQELAILFGKESGKPELFIPEQLSPGRLIRNFIDYVIKLRLNGAAKSYDDRYFYLAKRREQLLNANMIEELTNQDSHWGLEKCLLENRSHWHYLYLAETPQDFAIELDIKSAYITSLLQERTLAWKQPHGSKGYHTDDGGAMVRLREWAPQLPKWFRLQLLGILGSHQLVHYEYNPETGQAEPKVTVSGIKYGSAFNCVHKAIYKVYLAMAEVAGQVRDDLLRCHTDSFVLKATTTRRTETEMLSLLASKGFNLSCKGLGWAHFWDIDTGVIGWGQPKGDTARVRELVQRDNISIRCMPFNLHQRWGHWLPSIPDWMTESESNIIEFIPAKNILKESPEKLSGYWRVKINGEWHKKLPNDFQPMQINLPDLGS